MKKRKTKKGVKITFGKPPKLKPSQFHQSQKLYNRKPAKAQLKSLARKLS